MLPIAPPFNWSLILPSKLYIWFFMAAHIMTSRATENMSLTSDGVGDLTGIVNLETVLAILSRISSDP